MTTAARMALGIIHVFFICLSAAPFCYESVANEAEEDDAWDKDGNDADHDDGTDTHGHVLALKVVISAQVVALGGGDGAT